MRRRFRSGELRASISGRWGPRRVRVEECSSILTAERVYTSLLVDPEAIRVGRRGELRYTVSNASRLWVDASLDQKQRFQSVMFPDGLRFDGESFGTAVTCFSVQTVAGISLILTESGYLNTSWLNPHKTISPRPSTRTRSTFQRPTSSVRTSRCGCRCAGLLV